MRRLTILLGALTLVGACSDNGSGPAWYESGDVSYDSVKAAHDACTAKGGDYQLKPGGDPTHMGDYVCQKKASQ
ncbi:MAG TPA: hypothetical protein VGL58_14685 [Caulobacteraceae bacterium]